MSEPTGRLSSTPAYTGSQGDQTPPAPRPRTQDTVPLHGPQDRQLPPDIDARVNALASTPAPGPADPGFSSTTYKTLLDSAYSGVVLYDAMGTMMWASATACAISGYTPEDRIGRPGYEMIHPDDHEDAARKWMYVIGEPGRTATAEQRIIRKDGQVIWCEIMLRNMLAVPGVQAIVSHYHEITERKRAYSALRESERRQRELAHRDHLTGLLNRRAISNELERLVARAERGDLHDFAFLFVDLDGFKKVNDRLGHAFGDDYLRTTAKRLQEAMTDDDVVARMGGDEFAILVPHVESRAAAESIGHRLVHAPSDPVRIRGNLVQLPACVGVVTSGGRSWRPMDYLQYADTALYAAKQEGTGRVRVFDETLEHQVREQSSIASDLAGALEAQQLDVLYQPIVRLSDRRVVGLEALICWHHPTRGLLRAGTFIQAAEETGMVIPMGEFVFDRVCEEAGAWRRRFGPSSPWVSANLSAAQLIRQDFPDTVRSTLHRHGIEPGLVHLELTERGLFETEGPWRDRLWQAQAAGVPLMLDDFGTGYTSLRYLSEFPISVLKLDREYVSKTDHVDELRRARGTALMHAVTKMGHSLDLEIVAEGMETEAQHAAAVAAGCTLGQGWLYARAMPPEQVAEHLARGDWRL